MSNLCFATSQPTSNLSLLTFVSVDNHPVVLQVLAPLAIGLTLFVCHLIAIPIDGCW